MTTNGGFEEITADLHAANDRGAAESRRGNSHSTVLITGGAGYIGSHTAKALSGAGYSVVCFDNLSTGHRHFVKWGPLVEADLADVAAIRMTLRTHSVSAVIHCAGSAFVGESMRNPGLYFRNNASNTVNLLEAMVAENVRALVFSSSCAVYGIPELLPVRETHALRPVSPYGESKLACERQIHWYSTIHGLQFGVLRYFNVAGADLGGQLGEHRAVEARLIPLAIRAVLSGGSALVVCGTDHNTSDGTPVRDFVHVSDLAEAHTLAVTHLLKGLGSFTVNLGSGKGYSVQAVIRELGALIGRDVPVQLGDQQPGDPSILVADVAEAERILGWLPRNSDLGTILRTSLGWYQEG